MRHSQRKKFVGITPVLWVLAFICL
jgi:hypothetical protein